jgi:hypothetical protein
LGSAATLRVKQDQELDMEARRTSEVISTGMSKRRIRKGDH